MPEANGWFTPYSRYFLGNILEWLDNIIDAFLLQFGKFDSPD